jgi:proline iminopeptidase
MCRIDPWPDDIKASFDKYNWNVNNTMIGPYWTKSGGTYGSHDATSKLSKITVPTLFTSGEFDLISSGSMADYQHEVPGSMRSMIKDGSHLPWFESPNEYNRMIASFLSRIG